MVEIYIRCHGVISPTFGYFVPKNGNGNVNIHLLNYPGTLSCLFIEDITKSNNLLTYSSGDFIFDISISLDNYNSMFVTENEEIARGKEEGNIYERYIFLEGYNGGIFKHPIIKSNNKNYMFSNLLYKLEQIYPGETLDIKLSCCLGFDSDFECNSIITYFNILKENHITFTFKYITGDNIKPHLNDNIEIDCLKNGLDDLDLGDDDISDYTTFMDKETGEFLLNSVYSYIKIDKERSKQLLEFFKSKYEQCKKNEPDIIKEKDVYNYIMYSTADKRYKFITNDTFNPTIFPDFKDYILGNDILNDDIDSVYIFRYIRKKGHLIEPTIVPINEDSNIRKIKSKSLRRDIKLPNLVVNKSINLELLICILKHIRQKEIIDKNLKFRGEDTIMQFIDTVKQMNSKDIIIIPYQFICYIFFDEEPRLGNYFPGIEDLKFDIIQYLSNFCNVLLDKRITN